MVWCGYLKRQDNKKNKRYTIYSYSSSRLWMPRGSIVLALWIRWASRAFLKELRPFLSVSIGIKSIWSSGVAMVKSETRRDAETLVRNPSPRLFGIKFRDSKKVKTNHAKRRLRDLSKTLPRFRDPVKIFRDPRLSRYHSPPLLFEWLLVRKCSETAVC